MSRAEETGRLRGQAEKTLPDPATMWQAAAGNSGGDRPAVRSAVPAGDTSSIHISDSVYLTAHRLSQTAPTAAALEEVAAVSRPAALDQVQNRILTCVVELRRLEADSISVVLKPDPGTEIALHLQMRGNTIEVEAQFRRGDLTGLAAHWGQLQNNLSAQGVRLGSLQDTSGSPLPGQEFTSGQQHSGRGGTPQPKPESPPPQMPDPAPSTTRTWAHSAVFARGKRAWEM